MQLSAHSQRLADQFQRTGTIPGGRVLPRSDAGRDVPEAIGNYREMLMETVRLDDGAYDAAPGYGHVRVTYPQGTEGLRPHTSESTWSMQGQDAALSQTLSFSPQGRTFDESQVDHVQHWEVRYHPKGVQALSIFETPGREPSADLSIFDAVNPSRSHVRQFSPEEWLIA